MISLLSYTWVQVLYGKKEISKKRAWNDDFVALEEKGLIDTID